MTMSDVPTPLYWRILLKPRPRREKVGSILLPDDSQDVEDIWNGVYEVIAVGSMAFKNQDGEPWTSAEPPKAGDYVLADRRAGQRVTYDGQPYVILNDREVIGMVPDMYAVKAFYSEVQKTPID